MTTRCICLEDIENDGEIMTLKCEHVFHTKCIGDWIIEHGTCPYCRRHNGYKRVKEEDAHFDLTSQPINYGIEVYGMWMKQIIIAHFIIAFFSIMITYGSPGDISSAFFVPCIVFTIVLSLFSSFMIENDIAKYATTRYLRCHDYLWHQSLWACATTCCLSTASLLSFHRLVFLVIIPYDIYIIHAESVLKRSVSTTTTYTQLIA